MPYSINWNCPIYNDSHFEIYDHTMNNIGSTNNGNQFVGEEKQFIDVTSSPIYNRNNFEGDESLMIDVTDSPTKIDQSENESPMINVTSHMDHHMNNLLRNSPTQNEQGKLTLYKENRINAYTVMDIIGKGAYGTVLKVCHRSLDNDKKFALKMIQINNTVREEDARREINILDKLLENNSNNIHLVVNHLGHFIYKSHQCIVFPLMGCSLLDCMRNPNFPGFKADVFQRVALQTLHAIEFLHDNGVTHCDVRLSNIMLANQNVIEALDHSLEAFHHYCQEPVVKLIDFGISRTDDEDNNGTITVLINRAPEVILHQRYGHVSDVWSLGSSLLSLWIGDYAFNGDTELEQLILYTKLLGDPPNNLVENTTYYHQGVLDTRSHYKIADYEEAKDKLYDEIYGNVLKLHHHVDKYGKTNEDLLDLFKEMLSWDPAHRITAARAVQHKYFHFNFYF